MLEWLGRALRADGVMAVHPIGGRIIAVGAFADGDAWRHAHSRICSLRRSTFADVESDTLVDRGAEALGTHVRTGWDSGRSLTAQLVLGVAGTELGNSTDLGIFATGITTILSRDDALAGAELNTLLLERARIASDIHGVCQEVGTLRLQLQVLHQLMESDPPRARTLLADIEHSADLSSQNLRSAVMHLAPLTPDDTWRDCGLRAFVTDVAAAWRMRIEFDVRGDLTSLPPEANALLFACVQEGLTNIRKHSPSDRATVRVAFGEGHVRAQVISGAPLSAADNGDTVAPTFGHGLSIMRGRARLLGGDVSLVRSDTHHAVLTLELPV